MWTNFPWFLKKEKLVSEENCESDKVIDEGDEFSIATGASVIKASGGVISKVSQAETDEGCWSPKNRRCFFFLLSARRGCEHGREGVGKWWEEVSDNGRGRQRSTLRQPGVGA